MFKKNFFYKPEGGGGSGAGGNAGGSGSGGNDTGNKAGTGGNDAQNQSIATFDDFYKTLDESKRKVVDEHVTGLRTALQSERDEKKNLAAQLRDAQSKLEKGSDAERQLGELAEKAERATNRAVFVEEAIRPEVGCVNPKAAFLLAEADQLYKKSGEPDWEAIKKAAPELFRGTSTRGNAGNGTDNPPDKISMNDFIRKAAGR